MATSQTNKAVALAALGGAGFLVYQYWYKPYEAQRKAAALLAQQIRTVQASNPGMSATEALYSLGTKACQAAGMYYGVPPQLTGGVCNLAVRVASKSIIAGTKESIRATKRAGETIVKANVDLVRNVVVKPAQSVLKETKNFFSSIF